MPFSLGYALPVWRGRRLRDLPYSKNILLALVWAYITIFLPCLPHHIALAATAERALWVFALVLPFDIRDRHLDHSIGTQTFANSFSKSFIYWLSAFVLLIWVAAATTLYGAIFGLFFAGFALFLFALTLIAHKQQHDYFFSGLLDGLFIAQALCVGLSS